MFKSEGEGGGARGDLIKNESAINSIWKQIYLPNFIRIEQWKSFQNQGEKVKGEGRISVVGGISTEKIQTPQMTSKN